MFCVTIINIRGMELPNFVYSILFQHCKAYLFFNEMKYALNKGVLGCLRVIRLTYLDSYPTPRNDENK